MVHIKVEKKKHQQHYVEKLLKQQIKVLLKYGVMENKPDHFYILMNVLMVFKN
jgi:hypothetical protein